jgi:hypothetical protein
MDFQTEKPDSLKNNYLQLMEIPEQISETEIESVLKGIRDFEEGKTHAHEDVRKIYEKYL